MSKIIIDNRVDFTDLQAIELVKEVIEGGKIRNSEEHDCYESDLMFNGVCYVVYSNLNKNSERFIIKELH